MNPLVSIVTPSYNSAQTIADTIRSVLNQTYTNWELIIIDDCSTDNSLSKIHNYQESDSRIVVSKNKKNSGVAFSRNQGLSLSKGEYVCFLDADDFWSPNKLEIQVKEFLKNPNLNILTCSYQKVDMEGNYVGNKIIVPSLSNYKTLKKTNSIPCLSVMFKACIAKKYRFKKIGHEDYVFWLNVCSEGYEAVGLKEVLAFYRVGNSSLSSNKLKAAGFQWKIYREELNLGMVESVYYFLFYSYYALRKIF